MTIKNIVRKIFFHLSPLLIYKVSGNSMFPTYQDGDIVIALSWLVTIKKNDVVVIVDPRTSRLLLKRIKDQSVRKYFVIGDNQLESTDSRQFGWVHQRNIIGKVILQIKTEQGVFA